MKFYSPFVYSGGINISGLELFMSSSVISYSLLNFSVIAESNQQCVSAVNIQSKNDKHCFQTICRC